jgi:hypothetical protein
LTEQQELNWPVQRLHASRFRKIGTNTSLHMESVCQTHFIPFLISWNCGEFLRANLSKRIQGLKGFDEFINNAAIRLGVMPNNGSPREDTRLTRIQDAVRIRPFAGELKNETFEINLVRFSRDKTLSALLCSGSELALEEPQLESISFLGQIWLNQDIRRFIVDDQLDFCELKR